MVRMPCLSMRTASPGSTSRMNSAPMWSKAQDSDASTQPLAEPADAERAHAERVSDADKLGGRHDGEGVCALKAAHAVCDALSPVRAGRVRQHVGDNLGVVAAVELQAPGREFLL